MAISCNDILDNPQPSTSLSQEIALSDEGALRSVRAAMLGRLHTFTFTTRNMLGPDALADNLWNRSGSSRFQGLSQNQFRDGMADGGTYGSVYDLINDANLIIEAVEPGVVSEDELTMFRGEAYFLRAYAYHNLVKALGRDPLAVPTTGPGAGFDLGVVIRTNPTLDVSDADFRPRSTVVEVYQQMESDLLEAINLLGQSSGPSRFFVQQAAAEALLARVYLFWERWGDANTFAQRAIDNTSAVLTAGSDVGGIWNPNNDEGIFITLVDPSTESQGVNNSLAAYTSTQWTAQIPTADLISLYDEDDERLAWYAPCFDDARNNDFEASCDNDVGTGLEIQKYTSFGNTNFADNVPLLRVPEMILIQAEALLNTQGVADAISRLNILRESRSLDPLDPADFTLATALDEILDERRRELAAEGHRFYDLRRNRRAIRKSPDANAIGFPNVPFNDIQLLDNVPDQELETNPELVQNPGY